MSTQLIQQLVFYLLCIWIILCIFTVKNILICYDSGIVRGIDTIKGVLYVITPVPHSSLDKVNLLLQGYIQIPICLLQVRDSFISFSFLTQSYRTK